MFVEVTVGGAVLMLNVSSILTIQPGSQDASDDGCEIGLIQRGLIPKNMTFKAHESADIILSRVEKSRGQSKFFPATYVGFYYPEYFNSDNIWKIDCSEISGEPLMPGCGLYLIDTPSWSEIECIEVQDSYSDLANVLLCH